MAGVSLRDVNKRFGEDVLAVKDLSLDIHDGEFLVLLGPSGCGKTTTLRMIAGLERQTSGDVYIGERLVNALPAGERDIAFVFQFYALYPHLSVKNNISFPLRAQKVSRAEVDKRVTDVAKRLRIEHILHKRPNRLPGGEQQRVALARAMIRQPQVFLMDEPLTNLDAELRADMRLELKTLQHDLGTTMVYVTHDQVEAMSMGHRIAVMDNGVLQQLDAPLAIYNHPKTLFVARFIGSPPMNLLHCKREGAELIGFESTFRYILPASLQEIKSNDLYLGIRSEDVFIDPEGSYKGTVQLREPLGDETLYLVDCNGYTLMVKTPPKLKVAVGDEVSLSLNENKLHLFDKDTERSIL